MTTLRKVTRYTSRLHCTMILLIIVILLSFISFRLYEKNNEQYLTSHSSQIIIPESLPSSSTNSKDKKLVDQVSEEISISNPNSFSRYASDNHLRSLLRQQANSRNQVIATIVGGDSYSLFIWDWYERMFEVSNNTNSCHCFVIAMDEIAVILAVKQGIPVYYSTFPFNHQLKWINTIEVRQHSLYRVGHAKFDTSARIVQMGYSIMLSELDVFWKENLLNYLKQPSDVYDLQISHHYGAHPRVNIGLFYVRSSKASISFFSYVAEFWMRHGKGGYLSDQRVLDALLNNYDRIDKTYLKAMKPSTPLILNWTTCDFGNHFSHFMTDGSAFVLFNQAAKVGKRSKKFHGDKKSKYFTVQVNNGNMSISQRNLLVRALLILQHTKLQNRTLILPAFSSDLTITPIVYQLDIKKFFLYWSEERIRLPDYLLLNSTQSIPSTFVPYSSKKAYTDVNGILNFTLDSIPLNLPAPYPQFEVFVRDSLLWCSPPSVGGVWCSHHPRDYGVTMEILFSCRGDPYPPCANKTERNEQFLERPYEH
ncbi:unnamed protein product [Adineta steineri]|uniref:Nucleotide-diphospho-sugar transferase domain-containing protein n=3 Tax=Adineta steineri TaxID=433720 RepID=A0A813MDC1_9BILA|nr:unnamed protein product [Adineta steineri]CAF3631673.1 unnamed protein product [Adineta steineri]